MSKIDDARCRIALEKEWQTGEHGYDDKGAFFEDKKDEIC
jgi:hypothetical protein